MKNTSAKAITAPLASPDLSLLRRPTIPTTANAAALRSGIIRDCLPVEPNNIAPITERTSKEYASMNSTMRMRSHARASQIINADALATKQCASTWGTPQESSVEDYLGRSPESNGGLVLADLFFGPRSVGMSFLKICWVWDGRTVPSHLSI